MRDLKIFIIVAFIIGVMYYGVEPLAHHAMHPETAPSDYAFRDLEKFGKFDFSAKDANAGKEAFIENCASCHNIASQNDPALNMINPKMSAGAVVRPDLSNAGLIFDEQFLAHFIKDPVRATLLDAKFMVSCEGLDEAQAAKCEERNNGKESYPMTAFTYLDDATIVNIVAYLQSIAPKSLSDKEVFIEACSRCHSAVYDKNQYDSKFFAAHNAAITPLIDKAKNAGSDDAFIESLDDNQKAFMESLLGYAKLHEKMTLSEADIDAQLDSINAKTLADFGGANALLTNSLLESKFVKAGLQAGTPASEVKTYLGNTPPDLSMMIRSKGAHELAAFINNPQKIALVDIQKAVVNQLVKDKQNEEIAALPADLSEAEKKDRIKAIMLKAASDYGVTLPANTTKSEWQHADDYTNMAREMNAMPFGKSMPRVGLTQSAEHQVISYLETIGDSKKPQRDSLGLWLMGFFVILAALAYLWKNQIWRDLH